MNDEQQQARVARDRPRIERGLVDLPGHACRARSGSQQGWRP